VYNTLRPHSALGYRPPAPAACSLLVPSNPISQPMAVMIGADIFDALGRLVSGKI